MQKYFEKIPGERLFLSPMHPDDYELYTKWMNDPAVAVGFGMYPVMVTLPRERKHTEGPPDNDHEFSIVLRGDERLIGYICLLNPNDRDGTAEISIMIGEEADRGCGYGAEAMRLLLSYAFDTLRLHNIQLNVNSDNEQALACYKKVGFKEIGRRREAKWVRGGFVDVVYMDILAGEFTP